jgi:YidC/Oxa1 family membrane protein insertase
MEQRTVLAIVISIGIMVLWWSIFPPKQAPPQQPAQQPVATEPAVDPALPAPSTEPPASGMDLPSPEEVEEPAAIAAEVAEQIELKNAHFEIVLTNRGGRALSWKLRGYNGGDGEALEVFPRFESQEELPLALELDDPGLTYDVNQVLYRVERLSLPARGDSGPGDRVTFVWADGRGLEARRSFTVWDRGWLVDIEASVIDRGRRLPVGVSVGPGFAAQEPSRGKSTYAYVNQGIFNLGGDITRRRAKKMVGEAGSVSGDLRWAGLNDQYFAALILPNEQPARAEWFSVELTPARNAWDDDEEEAPKPGKEPILSVGVGEAGARLYVGPKNYGLLEGLGDELQKAVWFATNPMLAAISRWIFFGLVWIHTHVPPHNWGLSIVLATFVLRLLLFPVNQYAMVSMKKTQMQMQKLQPKIKAIKNKYKKKDSKTRQKMNEETMALYKKEGVNPMGGVSGCLPLLAQFPILIGFYNMLTVAVELRGAPFFGWILDLSQKDPYWILPLLMGASMFIQQKMAMSKVKDPMQQQQQKFMMFMPVLFTWICLQMPSGMVLYWFVNNLLGIGQQWLVNRHTGRLEAAAQKA